MNSFENNDDPSSTQDLLSLSNESDSSDQPLFLSSSLLSHIMIFMKSYKPSSYEHIALVIIFILYGIGMGFYAGTQPIGQWRFFSWHPLLMTIGMIALPGIAAVTKKLGGYTNTKIHAIVSWLAIFSTLGGYYIIYQNKENNGARHLTSTHANVGIFVMINMIGLGLFGSIVLHPDFGIDKTNKTLRSLHKLGARIVLIIAWFTAVLGLYTLVPNDYVKLMVYAAPLVSLVPYSLM